jgi:hypothetical protein
VSTPSRTTDLREALLAETLDEVVRLHDTVQAIAPKLHAALAEATTEAKKEVNEHAQAQAFYVEQTMPIRLAPMTVDPPSCQSCRTPGCENAAS